MHRLAPYMLETVGWELIGDRDWDVQVRGGATGVSCLVIIHHHCHHHHLQCSTHAYTFDVVVLEILGDLPS